MAFERHEELTFGLGSFVGMAVFATGFATYVLALSIGVRNEEYLGPTLKWAILAAGLVVAAVGLVLYARGGRQQHGSADGHKRTIGVGFALVGTYVASFAVSAQTTLSAPFLTTPRQKVLLFVFSFVTLSIGLVLLKRAASIIGW